LVGWITSFAGRRPTTRLPLKSLVQNESSGSIVAILSQKKGREVDRLLERPSPFKTRDQQFPFAPAMSLVGTRLPGSCSNLQRRPAAELDKGSGTAGLSRQIAAEARARLGRDGATPQPGWLTEGIRANSAAVKDRYWHESEDEGGKASSALAHVVQLVKGYDRCASGSKARPWPTADTGISGYRLQSSLA
jgi:hypothetical protein